MNAAQHVISKFGGQKALATLLGKGQSTVQYWAKAGTIPSKWHQDLLRLAAVNGIPLQPADLVIPPAPPAVELPELPTARYEGVLPLGGPQINCYVLSDGQRVISRTSATSALSGEW